MSSLYAVISDADNPETPQASPAWRDTTSQAAGSHFKKTCSPTYHQKMTEQTYNGWKNYETWNVTLWLQNDELLYTLAYNNSRACKKYGKKFTYNKFLPILECISQATDDGVKWNDPKIDAAAVDRMLAELAE